MNYKKLGKILGKIMILEGILMLVPLAVSFIYQESLVHNLAFLIPIVAVTAIGFLLRIPKPERDNLYQKEGFALTAMVWIVMTLFGAIPFVLSGDIPNYIDACFEMMSGFTTTGSSVITDLTVISHSTLFWRSFSHWIGGMGILVFIPESNDGSSMHLLRAESPGPQMGKLVSKMKVTTRILYLIYLGMTVLEVIILMLDKPIPGYESEQFFFSLLATFGCAGTGGFGFIPGSMELFHPFSQYVLSIFLILFGVNFSLYYLLLIGKVKDVLRSEEFKSYFLIIAMAVFFVFLSLAGRFEAFLQVYTTEEAFRHSLFHVALFLLSFDSVNGTVVQIASDAGNYEVKHGFFSNFSATLTCISNVGPAFETVGPYSSFAGYNNFSMVVLTLTMLLGRLEILPVLILLSKRTWQKI